jgi:hypothetical protein
MLLADPTDLQKLSHLKGKLWEELHAFFERQWKVVSKKICSQTVYPTLFGFLFENLSKQNFRVFILKLRELPIYTT